MRGVDLTQIGFAHGSFKADSRLVGIRKQKDSRIALFSDPLQREMGGIGSEKKYMVVLE